MTAPNQSGVKSHHLQVISFRYNFVAFLGVGRSGMPSLRSTRSTTQQLCKTAHRSGMTTADPEVKLGEINPQSGAIVGAAMTRARVAEEVGDRSECPQAFEDLQRELTK
jgi:hypothetical protein